MRTMTFDTQELVRELMACGLPHQQADAVVRTIVRAHTELATKHDIERLELRMTVKFGMMLFAAVGVLVAILRNHS
jgi:hypothetical protein